MYRRCLGEDRPSTKQVKQYIEDVRQVLAKQEYLSLGVVFDTPQHGISVYLPARGANHP